MLQNCLIHEPCLCQNSNEYRPHEQTQHPALVGHTLAKTCRGPRSIPNTNKYIVALVTSGCALQLGLIHIFSKENVTAISISNLTNSMLKIGLRYDHHVS